MEENELDLLYFLAPGEEPLRILTLESSMYLPGLRKLMPQAELYAVAADPEVRKLPEYAGLGVHWLVLDFREEQLPYAKGFFDYILAERYLEALVEPKDRTAGLGYFIRETGHLLTSFTNIRYWKILQELMAGHFYEFCTRPLAKPEVVRILGVSLYKEIFFTPQRQAAPAGVVAALEAAGFANDQDDLETKVWLVRASRSTAEVAALKSFYTPALRQEMVQLLRRVEYGIDASQNARAFWVFYDAQQLFPDYTADFIRSTVLHPERLLASLEQAAGSCHSEDFQAIVDCLRDSAE